jgi:hypothetical protein
MNIDVELMVSPIPGVEPEIRVRIHRTARISRSVVEAWYAELEALKGYSYSYDPDTRMLVPPYFTTLPSVSAPAAVREAVEKYMRSLAA